jgi:hypothetical protein
LFLRPSVSRSLPHKILTAVYVVVYRTRTGFLSMLKKDEWQVLSLTRPYGKKGKFKKEVQTAV